MNKEKKYLIYGIVLVLLTFCGLTYAYFATKIVGDKKQIGVDAADLKIIFNNGEEITGENIEPGWSVTKTFSVENKSDETYTYNIVINDLVNTFVTSGYLQYIIASDDEYGYGMTDYKDVPKSKEPTDTVIGYNISIEPSQIHNYSIEFIYNGDDNIDQSDDMGAVLSGNLYISKGTNPLFTDIIFSDNPTISMRTDFSTSMHEITTGTLFKESSTSTSQMTEDIDGDGIGEDVYYFAGNHENNWVKFGKFTTDLYYCVNNNGEVAYSSPCPDGYEDVILAYEGEDMYWRIMRINEDGSIRLLYAGNDPATTEGFIGYSDFNDNGDPMYAGYMYGTSGTLESNRLNTNDSKIKSFIDTWYEKYMLDYDKYISKSAIYCNDRSIGDGTYSITGSRDFPVSFDYAGYVRLNSRQYLIEHPSYKCGSNGTGGLFESSQSIADKFSVSKVGGGNGQLKYGVALMTYDEVVYAGGTFWDNGLSESESYPWFLTNNGDEFITSGGLGYSDTWWTLTPQYYTSSSMSTDFITIYNEEGSTTSGYSFQVEKVRPVISLKNCVKYVKGEGSTYIPYEVIVDDKCAKAEV